MTASFPFRVVPVGDAAVAVICGNAISPAVHRRVRWLLRRLQERPVAGLRWVPGYTVALGLLDPGTTVPAAAVQAVEAVLREADWQQLLSGDGANPPAPGKVKEIPVVYGGEYGPDLDDLARARGMSPGEFAARHQAALYQVYVVGFVPGFPYLAGLPPELAAPRLDEPRLRVPAGSVAIGGRQTGIYPTATPGGWRLIGRTPLTLFNPAREDPFLLHPGDHVRFTAIRPDEFASWARSANAQAGQTDPVSASPLSARAPGVTPVYGTCARSRGAVEVVKPGLLTSVQDMGRPGWEHVGVATGGAMDRFSAAVANLLVGNDAGAAVLECTLVGPVLRFRRETVIAVTGGNLEPRLNGSVLPMWKAVHVPAGAELALGTCRDGCRAYVAVAGGIDVPCVLGSRSTDLGQGFGGFQGRALQAGDELAVGTPHVPLSLLHGRALPRWARPVWVRPATVGFLPTRLPSALPASYTAAFAGAVWAVSPRSDRMGIRLSGPTVHPPRREVISEPVRPGTIQCPPNGQPIVLLADAQTMGGYPTLGVVCTADLGVLGQCPPGCEVRFEPVTEAAAVQKLHRQRRVLDWLALVNRSSP
ncbi:MAG: 5-oxoprolinase subunit PxpB [Alicyclobacillaceae bacterium]|nr:5-oxoprolinase subunit PxpB [Alicyclobacillaceae bacterium]